MKTEEIIAFLRREFPSLTETQCGQFTALGPLYRDWNARINVISRKDIDALYEHHVLHSLAIAKYLLLREDLLEGFAKGSVLDLGTGGGFPGIPLAILFPEASFTLCDSVGKKLIVASSVAENIGLQNITFAHMRAESLPGTFDFVVSRAVAPLTDFYPWVKGRFRRDILYLKGGDVAEEIALLTGRFRFPRGTISTWALSSWLSDSYYEGKVLVDLPAR